MVQAAHALTDRPRAPWRAQSQVDVEKTRSHVAATRLFLDEMHVRMRGKQRRHDRKPEPGA
jgi:hypothetical protein